MGRPCRTPDLLIRWKVFTRSSLGHPYYVVVKKAQRGGGYGLFHTRCHLLESQNEYAVSLFNKPHVGGLSMMLVLCCQANESLKKLNLLKLKDLVFQFLGSAWPESLYFSVIP